MLTDLRSLRPSSTSKPPCSHYLPRPGTDLDRSAVFRSNITMLSTVFASAFAMQLYVHAEG